MACNDGDYIGSLHVGRNRSIRTQVMDWTRYKHDPLKFLQLWSDCHITERQEQLYKDLANHTGRVGIVWNRATQDEISALAEAIPSIAIWRAVCCGRETRAVVTNQEMMDRWNIVLGIMISLLKPMLRKQFRFAHPLKEFVWRKRTRLFSPIFIPELKMHQPCLYNTDVHLLAFDETPADIVDIVCNSYPSSDKLIVVPVYPWAKQ